MQFFELLAVIIYSCALLSVAFTSYRKHQSSDDFILGSRSMNVWVTALAAHASDMSSWLFMAYPAAIFLSGMSASWLAIGLTLFMYFNWKFIAPRIRVASERTNALTMSGFFESHFQDRSPYIRLVTALALFLFYTIYIAAGLTGLGVLIESLFKVQYSLAILIGLIVVIPYLFVGGYVTLAWTDLFQGIFLLIVITLVPLYLLGTVGGLPAISASAAAKGISLELMPSVSWQSQFNVLMLLSSWGLGYFGQPHIITKFMGIKEPSKMRYSMWIGMTWQIIALTFATLIGLVAIAYFNGIPSNPETIFLQMVQSEFPPFLAAFVLCAILGVTITCMDSQILVVASSLAEDFYVKLFRPKATSKEILWASRFFIFLVGFIAYLIALPKSSSIYTLVSYAWFGLGSSFGPLLIFSLYSKTANRYGAWAGIITGCLTAALWPTLDTLMPLSIPTLVPGFLLSCLAIYITSKLTPNQKEGSND